MKAFIINKIILRGLRCKIRKLKDFYEMYCKYCNEVNILVENEINKLK